MKTLSLAIISTAIVLASCSSMRPAASSEYDDVYYNPGKVQNQTSQAVTPATTVVTPQDAMSTQPLNQEPAYSEPVAQGDEQLSDYEKYKLQQEAEMLGESYTPEGSEGLYATQYTVPDTLGEYGQEKAAVIVNNYYNDPTDYYYSSRLRRFSDNYYGWNYYDPYYTDMYWYTGSPFSWGISMGWGYPGWGMGFSYGNPYRPYYGYGGWYDPWYSWGGYYGGYYPYWGYGGSYWNGYYNGFYSGYYYGNYGNDYYNNYSYGRLSSRHSMGYSSRADVTTGSSKTSMAGDPRYRSRTTSTTRTATATRSNPTVTGSDQRQARTLTNTSPQRQVRTNTNSAVKTTRTTPTTTQQQTNSAVRRGTTYTPSYSKPRTSPTSTYNRSAVPSRSNVPSRSYTQPGTQSRTVTPTVRTPSSSSYSRPSSSSRSSSSYSRPSSSPSRSSSSYSSPSRSSGSYSSPSRSSGSSGSVSRSSGGSVSRSSGSGGGSSSRSSGSSRR